MSNKKSLPKKLDEDLNAVKHYKANAANANSNPNMKELMNLSKEKAMYDEIFGSLKNPSNIIASVEVSKTDSNSSNPNENNGFNANIVKRLAHVEQELKAAKIQLLEKTNENSKLNDELSELKMMCDTPADVLKELRREKELNSTLRYKLAEMEKFLADYGLIWVGSNRNTEENIHNNANDNDDGRIDENEHIVSFADFARSINELNAVIYAEPSKIITEGSNQRKARLVNASELVENIRVVYYKNGLLIRRGPFRHCSNDSYHSFVGDILDGYFPSEFSSQYPDGVILDLIDMRNDMYIEGNSNDKQQQLLSKENLLSKIPKNVVKNGNIFDIRNDIEMKLNDNNNHIQNNNDNNEENKSKNKIKSKVANLIKTPAEKMESNNNLNGVIIVSIQIKWIDTSIMVAKMFENDTIKDLKNEIIFHLKSNNDMNSLTESQFELRSAYPPRLLDDNLTMKDAGLSPNGTVHARLL
eukprot:gene12841-17215_t